MAWEKKCTEKKKTVKEEPLTVLAQVALHLWI